MIVLLGERYGDEQPRSGLSPTHEEFREARERCDVLAFVQRGVTPEREQQRFLYEVRDWASGQYTGSFSTADELRNAVVSALHDLEMSRKVGGVEEQDLLQRAREFVPDGRGLGCASLCTILVGGPRQQVIRPADIGKREFTNAITQEALFGSNPVFDISSGSTACVEGSRLKIEQEDASIVVDQLGSVQIIQPACHSDGDAHRYLPVLIEEDVAERVQRGLRFSSWLLDRVDPGARLTHVAPVASLVGADHMGWKMRAEQRRNPHTMQMSMQSGEELVATVSPAVQPRAALRVQAGKLAEDLTVLLRRQVS